MSVKVEILAHLDKIIAEGKRLISSFMTGEMGDRYSDLPESDFRSFYTRGLAAIERITGKNSAYNTSLQLADGKQHLASPGLSSSPIEALLGSIVALRADVEDGMLVTLENRLRDNIHDDFLQQAGELLQGGYHVAAMVISGGVLENHLQKMVMTHNLTLRGNGSLSKYNDALRATIYPQSTWRRIQSITDLRNDAAHGNTTSINRTDVNDSLQYIQRFLSDYPS